GEAMLGVGEAAGEQRAVAAAEEAIVNPLLDNVSLKGAKSMLLSITGSRDLTLWEVDSAVNRLREEVDRDANIIVGAILDDSLGEKMRVSIVASGMSRVQSLDASGQSDGPSWRPRCDLDATALNGSEHFGRRLSEAITQGDVQGKGRSARRTGGKAAASSRAARAKANGGAKKRAATQLPQRKSVPPGNGAAADIAAAHLPPPGAGGGGPVGWPEHWASAGEERIGLAPADERPMPSPPPLGSAARPGTLLHRPAHPLTPPPP